MSKKAKVEKMVAAMSEEELIRGEHLIGLLTIAKADGSARAQDGATAKQAGEHLKALDFIPADEKDKESPSYNLKQIILSSYFTGYGESRTDRERAWLAANSIKGLDDSVKVEANALLESARAAFGMFWKRAKRAAGLETIAAARPVGGATTAGEPGESENEAALDSKEAAAKLLADGDLAVAEWIMWASLPENRGHLKAVYAANVKP